MLYDDPIARYRTWLGSCGLADDAFAAACETEAETWVAQVRAGVIATPAPPPEWTFDWVFAEPTPTLGRQRREALGG